MQISVMLLFLLLQMIGQTPDTFYAMQLLENTGVSSLPGILYGQLPGTYHIR